MRDHDLKSFAETVAHYMAEKKPGADSGALEIVEPDRRILATRS